ncbi:hypothetical protein GCM10014715_33510 [Streptomyces spiralis]|uniref:Uncharacterized protein n=1 Tax=Streptomyces spiralis TaxID=66376 RepID=A0A918ZXM1_9ACTN|nr:hypothetical protein GCM10014715_33510 [Streptomyces spiralis]
MTHLSALLDSAVRSAGDKEAVVYRDRRWTHWRALVLVPVFLLLFLLVRGGPVYLLAPRDLGARDRAALTLFASTCLPLVVAITAIGSTGRSSAGTRPPHWSAPR